MVPARGHPGQRQRLLDAVLPSEEGADPALCQVAGSGLVFAVKLGTAKAERPRRIPLLREGSKAAELFIQSPRGRRFSTLSPGLRPVLAPQVGTGGRKVRRQEGDS
jgi:hypothetical protein